MNYTRALTGKFKENHVNTVPLLITAIQKSIIKLQLTALTLSVH